MRRDDRDDEVREAPGTVVAAVACGTAPLPFLAVYAVLFIVRGGFHPVTPPDITHSNQGELIAGLIALALFVLASIALVWLLSGRRRWLFGLVQLGVLGTAFAFALDDTKGGRPVSIVLIVAAVLALVLGYLPASWAWVGCSAPRWLRAYAVHS